MLVKFHTKKVLKHSDKSVMPYLKIKNMVYCKLRHFALEQKDVKRQLKVPWTKLAGK